MSPRICNQSSQLLLHTHASLIMQASSFVLADRPDAGWMQARDWLKLRFHLKVGKGEWGRYRETGEKEGKERRDVGGEMGLFLKEVKLREGWEELEREGRGRVR